MLKIKKGDTVIVISGDDKGKVGKVLKVFPKKQRVIVEGVNFIKRHTRPSQKNPQGGIIEKEAPIHISNVMLWFNNERTKVGFKVLKDGKKVRYSKKTGEIIDV
ncbi:MAG: 50S ribosomal protein L24 [Candidatus Neomarinimicrobiota bacterium]|nr:50S ribosomal protein L24 [Candidatus Neomarinimicrobiota bacterium]RKY48020.1 MAG: 50S ribosomal protein L24 [Candidatus Neomarinimicrobiota bacterium]HDN59261.1 50S ribosomal protein L24 [Candidatus Neomarinimicrobiota bacterium]